MGIIRTHHDLFEDVFVYSPKNFNAQCFKALVSVQEDITEQENETLEWFYNYVDACESKGTT